MADKRIFNLTEATTAGDNDLLALDNSNFPETRKIKVSKLRSGYVQKHDIAILDNLAGTTNTTGSTIRKDTYFYLDGILCVALADIAAGATFTFETNYDFATVGEELTDIKQTLTQKYLLANNVTQRVSVNTDGVKTTQTLLKELYDGFASIKSSISSSEVLHILGIRNAGGTWLIPENPESYYTRSTTLTKMSFSASSVTTGANGYFRTAIISSTLSENRFSRMLVNSGGNTYTDDTEEVPEANKQFVLTYQIFKNT